MFLDDEIYNHNSEPVISLIGLQEAICRIASKGDEKTIMEEADVNYWILRKAVMKNYLKCFKPPESGACVKCPNMETRVTIGNA